MTASNPMLGSVNKNRRIQVLRGLAILAVVIIHTYPSGILGVFLRPFVNFAVAMFIFLSGYLTKIDLTDCKSFMVKRIKRVLVPYCIWSVIYMIPEGFDGFVIKFFTGRCCGIYYYILVYIQMVLITPLVIQLIRSKYRWVGWCITPFFTVAVRYIFNFWGYDSISSRFNYLFVAWFIYYYFGMILGNNIAVIKQKRTLEILMYCGAIVLSVCEGLLWYHCGDIDMATTQLRLTSIGTSLTTILLAYHYIRSPHTVENGIVSRAFVLLGNTSFGVYLSHILIMNLLGLLPIWKYVIFPANSVIVLGISVICVLIGKKLLRNAGWVLGF